MGIKSVFLWGLGFPVMSRKIAWRVSSLIWVVLNERLAVVGGNCLQEGRGQGPFMEGECFVVKCDFQRGVSDSKSNSMTGVEARQLEITLKALL